MNLKDKIYTIRGKQVMLDRDLAELYGVQRPAITKHLTNIFESEELIEKEVSSILEQPSAHGALKGKTQINSVKYYTVISNAYN